MRLELANNVHPDNSLTELELLAVMNRRDARSVGGARM